MPIRFRQHYQWLIVMTLSMSLPHLVYGKSLHSKIVRLDFDKIHHLQISAASNITALLLNDTSLITMANDQNIYLFTKYNPAAPAYNVGGDKAIGAFDDKGSNELTGSRIALDKAVGKARWQGVSRVLEKALLLLDGRYSRMVAYNTTDNSLISSHTIIMDLLKPAKDSRGEPTQVETANFRQKLRRNLASLRAQEVVSVDPINERKRLKRTLDIGVYNSRRNQFQSKSVIKPLVPLSGLVLLPEKWREKERAQYLLATQIEGFPIVTMYCSKEILSNCQLIRGCFVEGAAALKNYSVTSIAVSTSRRMVLLGDSINHRLLAFHYYSCHHIQLEKTIELPDEIGELTALFVDDHDNLWLAVEKPDSFTNASIYMWQSKDW